MRLLNRIEYNSLQLNESYDEYKNSINEHIRYHIQNELGVSDSIFRVGSDGYLYFVNEMRTLHTEGKIEVSENDRFILEKLYTGKKGTWKNPKTDKKETVTLDDPRLLNDPKDWHLYHVYRPSKNGDIDKDTGLPKAVEIRFGTKTASNKPDVREIHQDPERRSAFLARHNCKEKKDEWASGWWSCNIHLFYKQLGLKTADPW